MTTSTVDRNRAAVLFGHFFLVILAYYQIKPASRSLYLEFYSASQLPYVWVLSALVLAVLIPVYGRLVSQLDRRQLQRATSLSIAASLVAFHFAQPGPLSAVLLYVFVDIVSVVLVEQFWSLANSLHNTKQGKRWFGLISSGGLLGGILAGQVVNALLEHTSVQTVDLLFVGAGLLVLLTAYAEIFAEPVVLAASAKPTNLPDLPARPQLKDWAFHPYLLCIAGISLLAQIVEPLVEFQFMHYVSQDFPQREARTAFLANFFSLMGAAGLAVNLLATPWIHRRFGVMGGLLAQPVLLLGSSIAFLGSPGLMGCALVKLSDRGLAYSINRASRELLYVPVSADLIYKLKAWIDMFGYRVFKLVGAVSILVLSEWTGLVTQAQSYSGLVIIACIAWIGLVVRLAPLYKAMVAGPEGASCVNRARMLIAELRRPASEQRPC